jgi:hypothetical protein
MLELALDDCQGPVFRGEVRSSEHQIEGSTPTGVGSKRTASISLP